MMNEDRREEQVIVVFARRSAGILHQCLLLNVTQSFYCARKADGFCVTVYYGWTQTEFI